MNIPDDATDDVLERRVADACVGRDKTALMHELQAAGITAGAVLNGPDLLTDPHLRARGGFVAQDRPGVGIKHYPNQPYRLFHAPEPPTQRAPLLGEHLEEVLTEYAGLTPDDMVELIIDDVIGTEPIAAR